jgi:hypothetical protein
MEISMQCWRNSTTSHGTAANELAGRIEVDFCKIAHARRQATSSCLPNQAISELGGRSVQSTPTAPRFDGYLLNITLCLTLVFCWFRPE